VLQEMGFGKNLCSFAIGVLHQWGIENPADIKPELLMENHFFQKFLFSLLKLLFC